MSALGYVWIVYSFGQALWFVLLRLSLSYCLGKEPICLLQSSDFALGTVGHQLGVVVHGFHWSLLFHLAFGPVLAGWNFRELPHPETVCVLGQYVSSSFFISLMLLNF